MIINIQVWCIVTKKSLTFLIFYGIMYDRYIISRRKLFMRSVTDDRRTRKTRAAIEGAFSELIQKKDINKITVRDITDLADTNRSTFYTHYEDIYHLLHIIEDKLIDAISVYNTPSIDDKNVKKDMMDSLRYISEHKNLYGAILNSSKGAEFLTRISEALSLRLVSLIGNVQGNEMVAAFYTSGSVSVIRHWVSGRYQDMSAEQICDFLENTIRVGITAVLNENK